MPTPTTLYLVTATLKSQPKDEPSIFFTYASSAAQARNFGRARFAAQLKVPVNSPDLGSNGVIKAVELSNGVVKIIVGPDKEFMEQLQSGHDVAQAVRNQIAIRVGRIRRGSDTDRVRIQLQVVAAKYPKFVEAVQAVARHVPNVSMVLLPLNHIHSVGTPVAEDTNAKFWRALQDAQDRAHLRVLVQNPPKPVRLLDMVGSGD